MNASYRTCTSGQDNKKNIFRSNTVYRKTMYTFLSSRVLKTEEGQICSRNNTFPLVPLAFEYLPLAQVFAFFWGRLIYTPLSP